MRSEAFADDGSDGKHSEKKGGRPIPLPGMGDGARASSRELGNSRDPILAGEGLELAKVSPFPTEVATQPPSHTPVRGSLLAHRETIFHPESTEAATPSHTRSWRNLILAALGIAVIAQGALMAYWIMSRGGLAALTSQTGSIAVTSEPSASQVSIDGAVRGITPLTIALDAGAHTVVVGTGEAARSQTVTVTRGGDASMHVQLPSVTAPAVPVKTALQVATEPAGARVWIDGEPRGVAPLTVSNLTAGDHTVTVRGGSGDPINRAVTVQQGTTASLVITMPNSGSSFASGWLSVHSPLALQVTEKGALLGTTDVPRIMLTAGEHELELVDEALGFRMSRTVAIAAGQTANMTITPPRGTLSINALPWAEVWIDGARVGETPIGNYSIPIGTHELLFRHPELGEQRRSVAVSAQAPVRVGVDMKKP